MLISRRSIGTTFTSKVAVELSTVIKDMAVSHAKFAKVFLLLTAVNTLLTGGVVGFVLFPLLIRLSCCPRVCRYRFFIIFKLVEILSVYSVKCSTINLCSVYEFFQTRRHFQHKKTFVVYWLWCLKSFQLIHRVFRKLLNFLRLGS